MARKKSRARKSTKSRKRRSSKRRPSGVKSLERNLTAAQRCIKKALSTARRVKK